MNDYLVNIPDNGYNVKINIDAIDIDLISTFSIPYNEFLQLPSKERHPFKGYMKLKHINFMRIHIDVIISKLKGLLKIYFRIQFIC